MGTAARKAVAAAYGKARADMDDSKFKELKELLDQFFTEEAEEPEHRKADSTADQSANNNALTARLDAALAMADSFSAGYAGDSK